MNPHEHFKVGDTVKLSEFARGRGLVGGRMRNPNYRGTVVSVGRKYVYVRSNPSPRSPNSKGVAYSPEFWDVAEP